MLAIVIGDTMVKYYGVISDPVLKDADIISGDYEWKPGTEGIGDRFGTVCHWFTDYGDFLDHIDYITDKLGLRLNDPENIVEVFEWTQS